MTTTQLTPIPPEVERDRFGRPKVVPPGGGPKVAYTRCTTFVGGIEDTYKLGQWQQRHVARGVALHNDLISAVSDTDADDKGRLDELVEEAKTRSGAGDSARMGTYLHKVTEAADRGLDPGAVPVPWMSTGPMDPSAYVPDLAAYMTATDELAALYIEQFCVQDFLKIGGTPDRVVKFRGKRYIADLKTGSIEWGSLKIAAQLAVYARSKPYDVATDTRLEDHAADVERGIVIHLPAGTGECRLYWVDLLAGWEAVRLCRDIRERRKVKFRDLMEPLTDAVPAPAPMSVQGSLVGTPELSEQITRCATAQAVRELWSANAAAWTEDLTELAKRHIASLGNNARPTEGATA